ncbi:MAG: hypothetical protein Q9161_003898 [Pseudevernia consocians]
MKSISSSNHSHIIKLLATFEQRGGYSMILPLAEENLRQFWAHSKPSLAASVWCLQEMTGIATALSYLHNDLLTQDSRPMIGYHFDLKPENILIGTDSPSAHRRWMISDFGLSQLHPKESRRELPPHPGLGTYEPPECQLGLSQSQAYDIWSLGCIYLECAAWSMKGSDAIDAFAEDRLNDVEVSGNIFKDDYFFTLELNESLTPVGAMTRPAVTAWIQDLESDPNCTEQILNLLHLIAYGLLQVDQRKRLNATGLSQRLLLIHQSAGDYLASGLQSASQVSSEARFTEIED